MLKGSRITLRPLLMSDLLFLKSIENNNENWQYGTEEKVYNSAELITYINNSKTDINIAKQYRFVIDYNSFPIGFIDLFNFTTERVYIGIIISKENRNKGFAKESLELIINYSFISLKVNKIYATISIDNLKSIKLFESCCFIIKEHHLDSTCTLVIDK